MTTPAPFQPIADLFQSSFGIRQVYGEPVQHGDTTVIPVAKVAYGFGAGVGRTPSKPKDAQTSPTGEANVGGGGGARLTPVGALEIGPNGTRYIHFDQLRGLLGALALGFGAGLLLGRRHA